MTARDLWLSFRAVHTTILGACQRAGTNEERGMGAQTWLLHLPKEECEGLLRGARIGRLGVVVDGKPEVFPVCHVFQDGCVMFPTNVGTKMHAALAWPYVGFEADGFEVDEAAAGGMRGWSVMVTGHAEEVNDAEQVDRATALRTVPWRTSPSLRWVRIVPSTITGRRIDAVAIPEAPER